MSNFEKAIPVILAHEGGALVEQDGGRGASRWGVTRKSYAEYFPQCTDETIRNLSISEATEFYERAFWNRYHIERIVDQELATKVFDLAVNVGPVTAIQLLQKAVGATVDGYLGPRTAAATNGLQPSGVLTQLRAQAEAYYRGLVARNPKQAVFLDGWLARLDS